MNSRPRYRTLAILTVAICILTIGASSARPPDPELAPPVPTNIKASDGDYADKVRITWNASAGATYYNLSRSGLSLVNFVYNTSYDDTTAVTLHLYDYKVQACVTGSCSAWSAPDGGYRGLATPVVNASDGTWSDRVEVTWGTVPGALSYNVYRGETSAGYQVHWDGLMTTHYTDLTALTAVKYYYWVRAISGAEESNNGQDTGYRNFTAPTGVSATDGIFTALVSVNWNTVAGAAKYQVWRDGAKIGLAGAGTYSDYSAVLGTLHSYRVKACNSDETICSALSAQDSGCRKLYAPTHLAASDGTYTDKVRLTWNASTGAGGYKVMRSALQGGVQTEIGAPVTTTFDDTTAAAGATYYYWVTACGFVGCSDPSGYETGYRGVATATPTRRPTNTPGVTPTWVPGAVPRIFLPVLLK